MSRPTPDCGPRALQIICSRFQVGCPIGLISKLAGTGPSGTSLAGLKSAAVKLGFIANGLQMNESAMEELKPPAIAWIDTCHYIAVLGIDGSDVTVRDPNHSAEEVWTCDQLMDRCHGIVLVLSKSVQPSHSRRSSKLVLVRKEII